MLHTHDKQCRIKHQLVTLNSWLEKDEHVTCNRILEIRPQCAHRLRACIIFVPTNTESSKHDSLLIEQKLCKRPEHGYLHLQNGSNKKL